MAVDNYFEENNVSIPVMLMEQLQIKVENFIWTDSNAF